MAKIVHQAVTVYNDGKGSQTGVCICGKAFPLQAATDGDITLAMHISLQNRNEAMDV